MHLSPRDLDKLLLHNAGSLAQRRLARGLRLNYPEAVAVIATVVLEHIRDGTWSVAQLMDVGRRLLGRRQVQPGVPEMVDEVQVEGTFPDGTKLVTVHQPIVNMDGEMSLALHGSFLPVPALSMFNDTIGDGGITPGEYVLEPGDVVLNGGRDGIELTITNTGDRPVQVGSHYPFAETNAALRFDRTLAYGRRLDIPAGTAVRFEPGESKPVPLVPIGGQRIIQGGNRLASGPVTDEARAAVAAAARERGFLHTDTA